MIMSAFEERVDGEWATAWSHTLVRCDGTIVGTVVREG